MRFTLLAISAASLVLTQHAQCADVESKKGPLTQAELAQCQVQLTEFNQNVRTNNVKVEEIKVLEAEIDALSTALEKEEVTVDRHDKAAMSALNAKIAKNNELVEQHETMVSSIKTMQSQNKERRAQYQELCENRPLALKPAPQTQLSESVCNSTTGVKDVQHHIEAALAEMRTDEKKHQAEVERVAQAQARAQSWNSEKRGNIWLKILASPKFTAFEREKRPYAQELMRILASKPKGGQEECKIMQRIAATLPAIKAINAKQYAFMADEIRAAK